MAVSGGLQGQGPNGNDDNDFAMLETAYAETMMRDVIVTQ